MNVSVKAVRATMPAESRERSTIAGLGFFAAGALTYVATLAGAILLPSLAARTAMAVATGLAIAILFVVGHDACHGSLTRQSWLNDAVARIAFLPALHPRSAWEYSHNALHHGWTNLRGKDPVYCPLTLAEFRALTPGRRRLERLYRSWFGLLPLYLVTIWWSLELHPSVSHRAHMDKRGDFALDRVLVVLFGLSVAVVVAVARESAGDRGWTLATGIVVSGVLPFLVFSWLIAFATFQHHTHPRILWYEDEEEWNFFRAQVQGTVHVEFPRWIESMLNNIMEHTAHHVDPKVPLYRLTKAQDSIEAAFGEENVIRERFSFAGLSNTFRVCQLYDYSTHCWMTFDGLETTARRCLIDEANPHRAARVKEQAPRASFAEDERSLDWPTRA